MNAERSVRLLHPVRSSTHDAFGMGPFVFSHASTCSGMSRKSSFFATSAVTSMTHAGPTNLLAGIVSHVLAGRSFPVIQCTGASKCVPVCSPMRMVFQYHAGPRLSKFEITSIETPGDAPNCDGNSMTGVSGPSGAVRSTIFRRPAARSLTTDVRRVMSLCEDGKMGRWDDELQCL